MALDKPERLRFNINDDLVLLREVIAANPYEDICQWKEVHERTVMATGKSYSLRAIKEHVIHLLKLWSKADTSNLRKSGTEEQYEEKEHLLQAISHLISNSGAKKSFHEARKRGLEVTEEALHNITTLVHDNKSFVFTYDPIVTEIQEPNTSFSDVQTPQASQQTDLPDPQVPNNDQQQTNNVRKKRCKENTLKSSLLKYLNKRQEEESSLKNKELQIEETKLDIEKKKVELEERRIKLEEDKWKMEEREREAKLEADITERQQRLAMEMEERRQRLNQTEQQQKLTQLMFQFFTKNSV